MKRNPLSLEQLTAIITAVEKDAKALKHLISLPPSPALTQYSIDEYKQRSETLQSALPILRRMERGKKARRTLQNQRVSR